MERRGSNISDSLSVTWIGFFYGANAVLNSSTEHITVFQGQGVEELPATHWNSSLYRESDAQTDAYTPEYIIAAGQDPEVLQLSRMTSARRAP